MLAGMALMIGTMVLILADMQLFESAHGGYIIPGLLAGWGLVHLCVQANWGNRYTTLLGYIIGAGGFGFIVGLSLGTVLRLLNTGMATADILDATLRIVLMATGFIAPYLASVYPRSKPLLRLTVKDE